MGIEGVRIEPSEPRTRRIPSAIRAATRVLGSIAIASFGCASDLVAVGEGSGAGFRHRSLGYTISVPAESRDEPWRRVSVEGADLAFSQRVAEGEATMTLLSECRSSVAPPVVRARNLLIGVSEHTVRASGPVELHGDDGWSQTFDLEQDGVPIRVKAVTIVSGDCTFDWVLVAPGPLGDTERSFDRWWSSFVRADGRQSALANREVAP